MSQDDVKQLLREGIEAARAGDRARARTLLTRVTESDEENEQAWLWLASVMDSDAEKRMALSNVLFINPDNEQAQRLMDKLSARATTATAAGGNRDEILPGVPRRLALRLGAGLGGALLVVVALLLFGNARRGAQEAAQIAQSTRAAQVATDAFVTTGTAQVVQATATQEALLALFTATPTPTQTPVFVLPPTFTPTPLPAAAAAAATPLLPPPNPQPGAFIAAWGGEDLDNDQFYSALLLPLDASPPRPVGNVEINSIDVALSGERLLYTRQFTATFDYGIESMNIIGTQIEDLATLLAGVQAPFIRPQMPRYAPSGQVIVFVALMPDTTTNEVFTLSLQTLPPGQSPLQRLTNDNNDYSWPDVSPDGTQVLVTKETRESITPGFDLVILNSATGAERPFTTDGAAFRELSGMWSPDGTRIAYAAAPADNPDNYDIILLDAAGTGVAQIIGRSPANEIFPVFSPDGSSIAFASDRSGVYQVYIADLNSQAVYQLTTGPDNVFPGGWHAPSPS